VFTLRLPLVQLLQDLLRWSFLPPLLLLALVLQTSIVPALRLQLHHVLREERTGWLQLYGTRNDLLLSVVAEDLLQEEIVDEWSKRVTMMVYTFL
jgi:hypothetical protein